MRSTGEVMGIDADFGAAFAKSQVAAYSGGLPKSGKVLVSVANRDKRSMIFPVKRLVDLGFEVVATSGTADVLCRHGIPVTRIRKHYEGPSPGGHHRRHPPRRHRPSSSTPPSASARASTGTRSAPPRSPWACPASPRCRRSVPRCRGSRPCWPGLRGALAAGVRPGPGRCAAAGGRRVTRAIPQQIESEVLDLDRVGDYFHLTLAAPTAAALVRPGHFVAVAVGGPTRRCCCAGRSRSTGPTPARARWRWSSPSTAGDRLAQPRRARRPAQHRGAARDALLAAERPRSPARWWPAATAPLPCSSWAASCGSAAAASTWCWGCHRDPALRHLEARRAADAVVVTTVDGSAGRRGLVTDPLRTSCPSSARRSCTPVGRWACCRRWPSWQVSSTPTASARSRSRWPAGSASA